jgi:ubiquinone/menaquinone biosynthesis C-methylase UbiE
LQASQFASRYVAMGGDAYRDCFAYSRKRLNALLAHYIPERGDGIRLLDVGCGTGHHMAEMRERGFEVAGVDGSADMLGHARMNNPGAEIHQSDVDRLPFPDASFDMVMSIEVLRYLPRPHLAIREMARVLRPGGLCLATAAPRFSLNGYWLVNRLAHLVRVGDLVRLKQFFTTSWRLRRQFADAGFAAPAIHGVYFGPVNWVQRIAPWLLARFLRLWEPIDMALADRPVLREFSNMFLVHAVRA